MPITPFIHVTAAFSNAVLVAILPHVSDFAQKLDLPIPQPITASQVAHFNVNPMKGFIGGGLWLTNHYQFAFDNGYVHIFRNLNDNPFLMDDPAQTWPRFAGKDNMTTNDAIELARDTLRKLGYDPKLLHADVPPFSVHGPSDMKAGYHFPYCDIWWDDDKVGLNFQIDMNKKMLVGMSLSSTNLFRPNPKIDVVPELESDYQKRIQGHMFIRTNAAPHLPAVNPADAPSATPPE